MFRTIAMPGSSRSSEPTKTSLRAMLLQFPSCPEIRDLRPHPKENLRCYRPNSRDVLLQYLLLGGQGLQYSPTLAIISDSVFRESFKKM